MHKIKTNALTLLLALALIIAASPVIFPKIQAANPVADSAFSIMQVSDTQHLAFLSPTLYNDTTSWIVNNSANYNLQMVIHTGDFIDAFAAPPLVIYNETQKAQEWAVANASMSKLLSAGIPYCWCAGNHDQTPLGNPNGTMTGSNYLAFNATYMRSKPYWVSDIYNSKNTAVKFSYNNYQFLIINLEYMANSSAIAWMEGLLDGNPGANVIVTTHGYLNANADYSSSSSETTTWNNAFKATLDSYPNIFLALSGHIHGWNMTRVGNRQEILFDFQEANNKLGAAAVRIYTFDLASMKVSASTYSLYAKTWLTDAYNQFSFDVALVQGLYRDWQVMLCSNQIYIYPPQHIEGVYTAQCIGTWDAEYYDKLGKTVVDAAKPAIDESISNCGNKYPTP